jgi:hypothetical protein
MPGQRTHPAAIPLAGKARASGTEPVVAGRSRGAKTAGLYFIPRTSGTGKRSYEAARRRPRVRGMVAHDRRREREAKVLTAADGYVAAPAP